MQARCRPALAPAFRLAARDPLRAGPPRPWPARTGAAALCRRTGASVPGVGARFTRRQNAATERRAASQPDTHISKHDCAFPLTSRRPRATGLCSICQAGRGGCGGVWPGSPLATRVPSSPSDIWRYRSGTRPGIDRHAHSGWSPGPRAPPVSRYADKWGRVKPLLVSAQASVGVVSDARRRSEPCSIPLSPPAPACGVQ